MHKIRATELHQFLPWYDRSFYRRLFQFPFKMRLQSERGHSCPLVQRNPRRADRNVRAPIRFRISFNLQAKWN